MTRRVASPGRWRGSAPDVPAVGSVELPNPVMTGVGDGRARRRAAPATSTCRRSARCVVKSLAAFAWDGQPGAAAAPRGRRACSTPSGCRARASTHWRARRPARRCSPPASPSSPASGVASVDDYRRRRRAARRPSPPASSRSRSTCRARTSRVGGGSSPTTPSCRPRSSRRPPACGRPRWAKLSPNTDRVVEVAAPSSDAGADAVTLVNTLLGMVIDPSTRRPALGAGGGATAARPIHPVAVRTVFDVHAAHPDLPIVGVGGVASGWDAVELMLAGASAVQVGTATFAEPARRGAGARRSSAAWMRASRRGHRPRADRARPTPELAKLAAPATCRRPTIDGCRHRDRLARVRRMATPPQLTPEQRTAALAKAAEARTARAELKNQLKLGSMSLADALASTDSTVGQAEGRLAARVLPGVGKVKARKIMDGHRHRRQPPRPGSRPAAEAALLDQLGK